MATTVDVLEAVERGDADALRLILGQDRNLARVRDTKGVSALLQALYQRRLDLVELLRHDGLDLYEAAALGDAARLTSILSGGTRPTGHAGDGFTALQLAAYFARPEAVRLLIEAGADPNAVAENPMRIRPLHAAVAAGDAEVVRLLLEAGANPDVQQRGGWTPLHSAVMHGRGDLVELLLGAGADRSIRADDGRRPADLAREKGHAALADRLA